MTNNLLLLELLEELLGEYKEYKKQNEVAFFCPACKHYKKKLQVNIVTGRWHCWVCMVDNSMAGKTFYSLFKKVGATEEQYRRLSSILGTSFIKSSQDTNTIAMELRLPAEFISLLEENNSPHYKNAIYYLKKRGLTPEDILKYNIGYAEYGRYKGKIIIPSYDSCGKLNFFTSRAFYSDDTMKHVTPSWDKNNIVGFELFINWSEPIVLVEGVFDAIAVKRNAIPLFGKSISTALKKKILEHNVQDIYIALDKDALANSIKYAEMFMGEGRIVYIVDLIDKDPSLIGFDGMRNLIKNTQKLSLKDLVRYKLRCK